MRAVDCLPPQERRHYFKYYLNWACENCSELEPIEESRSSFRQNSDPIIDGLLISLRGMDAQLLNRFLKIHT